MDSQEIRCYDQVIKWLKGLSAFAIIGSILAFALALLRARSAGKMEANIEHSEEKIRQLNRGTDTDIQSAKVLQQEIKIKKVEARAIRHRSEAAAERAYNDSETMADISFRFNNSGRVRRRSNPIAEPKRSRKKH